MISDAVSRLVVAVPDHVVILQLLWIFCNQEQEQLDHHRQRPNKAPELAPSRLF